MRDNQLNEPAAPVSSTADFQFLGLSIRDFFAAAALQGMCANADVVERMRDTAHAENIDPQVLLATAAFGAADAMLQERAK